jgi:hypothetical protein
MTGLMSKIWIAVMLGALAASAQAQQQPPQENPASAGNGVVKPAGPDGKAPPADPKFQKNLERWKNLPPEKQEQMRKFYEKIKSLPEAERAKLLQNAGRFGKMDPARRKKLMEVLKKLPPERRAALLKQMGNSPQNRQKIGKMVGHAAEAVKKLPVEERERIKALPPDEKKAEIRRIVEKHMLGIFQKDMTDAQKTEFAGLSKEEQTKRMKVWLKERLGKKGPNGASGERRPPQKPQAKPNGQSPPVDPK